MKVERASISDQQRRIAREAAAQHSVDRLTDKEEDGGLALPWEQSLRGAAVHEVQVGHLFSGLYCRITQPSMDEMSIIRTSKQLREAAEAEEEEGKAETTAKSEQQADDLSSSSASSSSAWRCRCGCATAGGADQQPALC